MRIGEVRGVNRVWGGIRDLEVVIERRFGILGGGSVARSGIMWG